MPIEYRFECMLRNGLHARPASLLAEAVRDFAAEITLSKTGAAAVDIRSVLSVIGLDVKVGEACVVVASGDDAQAAVAALRELVEGTLACADEHPALPGEAACDRPRAALPIGLRHLGPVFAEGQPVCAGIGQGVAIVVGGLELPPALRDAKPGPTRDEADAVRRAMESVRRGLRRRAAEARGEIERELLTAHSNMACDPTLLAEIELAIGEGHTAARGVVIAGERLADRLRAAESAYIRDRALDVQDVSLQLLDRLVPGGLAGAHTKLSLESVVFAEALTPSQLLGLDRPLLRGLVLGRVGATSHTVILARTLGVPTLIDVAEAPRVARPGRRTIVDGDAGIVLTDVTPPVSRYYERRGRTLSRRRASLEPIARSPGVTADGVRLEIGVNAGVAAEVAAGVANGADGVGLLRTEMLFLDRAAMPGEAEQLEAYSAALAAAGGRPVIIRTLDIGGDKPAAYLRMPREDNPFLGVRGLRLYERHPGVLRTQLRAVLRAGSCHDAPLKVMAPMVATVAEAAWFRAHVEAARDQLSAEGVALRRVEIGVMVEVPAAALAMDQLCEVVDFFSIGTNDLCQYFMGVDRGNAALAGLYNPRQPALLRLLDAIVRGARRGRRWIGVCGEMAGDRTNLPLMLGLGVDEISVAPGAALGLKAAARGMTRAACRTLLEAAMACRTVAEVDEVLRTGATSAGPSLGSHAAIDAALIDAASDAQTKEEAIRDAVDLLYVSGRTERPDAVEAAVWAREETYSTGLGYAFAVPHCKTDAVAAPALAVVKLRQGVEWGSMDAQPVRVVLLLAVPAGDTSGAHMKIFATLARRLMHETFRERLMNAATPELIVAALRAELGLGDA